MNQEFNLDSNNNINQPTKHEQTVHHQLTINKIQNDNQAKNKFSYNKNIEAKTNRMVRICSRIRNRNWSNDEAIDTFSFKV